MRDGQFRGVTLLETVVSLSVIALLLSILVPALSSARVASHREKCQNNQRQIGQAWSAYLEDNDGEFPHVPVQPGWFYGGCRFSSVDEMAFPDFDRPLTSYLALPRTTNFDDVVCCCPADEGITDVDVGTFGTGRRTAFRSFGTSYRLNAALVSWDGAPGNTPGNTPGSASGSASPVVDEPISHRATRSLRRMEITTPASRLVLMGDPIWYELAQSTGRKADWHGHVKVATASESGTQHRKVPAGNVLFLDGSVKFVTIKPREQKNQPVMFDPIVGGAATPDQE